MKTAEQLKQELHTDVKKMSSEIDLILATIRCQLLELEIAKSNLHLKLSK